jgi:5-methylthioribose kinase
VTNTAVTNTAATTPTETTTAATTTALLDGRPLADHLARIPAVAARLGGRAGDWAVREIGDGNVNYVYEVRGPAGRLCVKQAMPYVRVVGEAWPLSPRRAWFEHRALLEHARHAPERVPEVVHHDEEHHLLVVEYLTPHVVLRQGLAEGVRYPWLAGHLAEYLAATLVGTGDLARPAAEKRPLVALFQGNTEMTRIMEDMVFTEPYQEHPRNAWTSPQLDAAAARLRTDSALKTAVSRLKLRYLTSAEALLHGDLHTGSVLVTPTDTKVIDQEFACYGPAGFDLGTLLAHLLVAALARGDGHVLATAEELWQRFTERYLAHWEQSTHGDAYPRVLFPHPADLRAAQRRHLAELLADTLAFCGAELLRRIFGLAHAPELQAVADPEARAAVELRCVRLAVELLTTPELHPTVPALTAAAYAVLR